MIYEAWRNADSTEVTMSTLDGIAEQRKKGLIDSTWVMLHRIESLDWNAAMTRHHELMGFEPYKPF